jgi:hypothetical protein
MARQQRRLTAQQAEWLAEWNAYVVSAQEDDQPAGAEVNRVRDQRARMYDGLDSWECDGFDTRSLYAQ